MIMLSTNRDIYYVHTSESSSIGFVVSQNHLPESETNLNWYVPSLDTGTKQTFSNGSIGGSLLSSAGRSASVRGSTLP